MYAPLGYYKYTEPLLVGIDFPEARDVESLLGRFGDADQMWGLLTEMAVSTNSGPFFREPYYGEVYI